jgi:hypothetical protein
MPHAAAYLVQLRASTGNRKTCARANGIWLAEPRRGMTYGPGATPRVEAIVEIRLERARHRPPSAHVAPFQGCIHTRANRGLRPPLTRPVRGLTLLFGLFSRLPYSRISPLMQVPDYHYIIFDFKKYTEYGNRLQRARRMFLYIVAYKSGCSSTCSNCDSSSLMNSLPRFGRCFSYHSYAALISFSASLRSMSIAASAQYPFLHLLPGRTFAGIRMVRFKAFI